MENKTQHGCMVACCMVACCMVACIGKGIVIDGAVMWELQKMENKQAIEVFSATTGGCDQQ